MKRHLHLLIGLAGSVLLSSLLGAAMTGSRVRPGPASTVAALQAGLADDAPAWVGRTVRVRGMAEPCPWWGGTARLWQCADDPFILVPDPADPVAAPLPLSPPTPNALLTLLRGLPLPLLRDLQARSPAVPLFTPARFQVHVYGVAAQACGGRWPCYEAQLLDSWAHVVMPVSLFTPEMDESTFGASDNRVSGRSTCCP